MTRIAGRSLADIQFRPNDTVQTRVQKLELIRDVLIQIVGEEGEEFPPHTHEISDIINLQEILDGLVLTLFYRFGAFWVAAPLTNETMMLHTVTDEIRLYADALGSVGDIGGLPVADMLFTIWRNPTFTGDLITGGEQIGTMTIDTAGAFTFETTDNQPIQLFPGETVGVKAPATVEATAVCGSFTFIALMSGLVDYLALEGDMQDDGDDVLLLEGDMQDSGTDRLILIEE